MIEKVKQKVCTLKGKRIRFRYNGSRNQIEEFEVVIVDCYNYVFVIATDKVNRSFSYSDVFIGVLELNV